MWQVNKPLRPHALSVGQARNFCVRRLESVLATRPGTPADGSVPDVIGDVATIASELVTNAVAAGAGAIEMHIALRPTSLLVDVMDDAGGEVVTRTATATDTAGRGLLVVAALSQSWGVRTEGDRKHVWAEVSLAAPDSPSSHVA